MVRQNETRRVGKILLVLASSASVTVCQFLSVSTVSAISVAYPQSSSAAPAVSKVSQARRPAPNNSAVLTNYWNGLRAKLQTNWQIPDGKNRVSVTANVNADGSVSDLVVTANPKEAQAEVSATEAFNRSLPFPALPQGVARAKISVIFEYSYDPHGDGSSRVSGTMSQIQESPAANTGGAPAEGAPQATPTTSGNSDSSKY